MLVYTQTQIRSDFALQQLHLSYPFRRTHHTERLQLHCSLPPNALHALCLQIVRSIADQRPFINNVFHSSLISIRTCMDVRT